MNQQHLLGVIKNTYKSICVIFKNTFFFLKTSYLNFNNQTIFIKILSSYKIIEIFLYKYVHSKS